MNMILSMWKRCRKLAAELRSAVVKHCPWKSSRPIAHEIHEIHDVHEARETGEAAQATSVKKRTLWTKVVPIISIALMGMIVFAYGAIDRQEHDDPYVAEPTYTFTLYEVTVDDVSLGLVSDPAVIESYIHDRYEQVQAQYPDVQMKLTYGDIAFREQVISLGEAADEEVLAKLAPRISSYTEAVAIRIDGELIGYVPDQAAAEQLFNEVKQPYNSEPIRGESDPQGDVRMASISDEAGDADEEDKDSHVLARQVDFLEEVNAQAELIQPGELSDPHMLAEQIQTGGAKPVTYVVREGDTIYDIARSFDISSEVIYRNNTWIENDMLHPGDVLNLTVWQPLLSVKVTQTIERKEEIPFSIEYESDPNMPEGQTKVISEGISGERLVTIEETTVNGILASSHEISSSVLREPVSAKYIRGTKVVSGMDDLVQKLLGVPYVWGGTTTSGFDCSGFTMYVLSRYGVDLPRTSVSQAESGTQVAKKDLRKGDLVFFNTYGPAGTITHVAIYMGDGKIANALSSKVQINDLHDDYFSNRYITARRVLNDEQYRAIQ